MDAECLIPESKIETFEEGYEMVEKGQETILDLPEMEYLARLKNHQDLFDHPLIASMIWLKWRKCKKVFWALFLIKFLQHFFGIIWILSSYLKLTEDSNETEKSGTAKYLKILFMSFSILAYLKLILVFAFLFRKRSMVVTLTNWKIAFDRFNSSILMAPFLISILVLPEDSDTFFFNKRDMSGFYVLLASFDLFLELKTMLTDRKMAAMIAWTQVVSKSMLQFILVMFCLLNISAMLIFSSPNLTYGTFNFDLATFSQVHSILLMGFMGAFHVQLQKDEESETFETIFTSLMKTMAMFVGELEYGDFPFQDSRLWNHLTFILFVYFVVLVMMNLLTGVALMDGQEIMNASR